MTLRTYSPALTGVLLLLAAACDRPTAPVSDDGPDTGPAAVHSIVIEPPDTILHSGTAFAMPVRLLSRSGEVLTGRPITWSSSDTTIARMNWGTFEPRRAGVVTISATSEGKVARVRLTLHDRVCTIGERGTMPMGISTPIRTYLYGPGGVSQPTGVTITSADPSVASVAGTTLTTHAPGKTTLTLRCDAAAGTRYELTVVRGYAATRLGTLGGAYVTPYDLNEAGDVVGESTDASGAARAFLWRGGRMTALELPGARSRALGISESGAVVGVYTGAATGETGFRPFLWRDGAVTLLQTEAEEENVYATAVNSAGTIVGYSRSGSGDAAVGSALVWRNGRREDLGRMGGHYTELVRINEAGTILGVTYEPREFSFPQPASFLLRGEQRTELDHQATGLSDDGFVSGTGYWTSANGGHSYVWKAGRQTEIYFIGRHSAITLYDVNDAGQAVGTTGAAVVTEKGVVTFLDQVTLGLDGWSLRSARGINDRGQIIAVAQNSTNGWYEPVLLTPR